MLELWPNNFDLCLLQKDDAASLVTGSEVKTLTVSCQETLGNLYVKAIETLGLPRASKSRFWRIDSIDDLLTSVYPANKLIKDGGKLLPESGDSIHKTMEELYFQEGDTLVLEVKGEDGWLVDANKVAGGSGVLSTTSASSSAVQTNDIGPLFESGSDFFSKISANASKPIASSSSSTLKPPVVIQRNNGIQSGSTSYGKSKADKRGNVPGIVGFSNMCVAFSILLLFSADDVEGETPAS